jgi:transcriptional regulator with XRE-family HTH domain
VTTTAGEARPSAEPITAVIAERVRDLRDKAGLSQEELAEKMRALGPKWKRSTVVNLETRASGSRGKGAGRDAVTVQELLALAIALDVPPVLLLADPRSTEEVPVADGITLGVWEALLWLVGTDSITPGRTSTEAAWLINAGFTVVEALTELDRVDRDQALTDRRHANALQRMRLPLARIIKEQAAPLPLNGAVYQRAAELGVHLPGQEA